MFEMFEMHGDCSLFTNILASPPSLLACCKTGYLCLKHFVEICPLYRSPNYIQQTNAIFQQRAYLPPPCSLPSQNFLLRKWVGGEDLLVMIYNYRPASKFCTPPLLALAPPCNIVPLRLRQVCKAARSTLCQPSLSSLSNAFMSRLLPKVSFLGRLNRA